MSTLKVNNLQVGQDGTAANNYTLYQPASPDGTVRLGYGVAGSVTDILTLKNSRLGIGENNPVAKLHVLSGSGDQLWLDNAGERYTQISLRNNGTQKAALWLDETNDKFDLFAATGYGIRFLAGGTEKLLIDSNGRIGIGGNGVGSGLGVYLQRSAPNTTHFYEASDGTKKMITGVDSTNDYVKIGSLSNHRLGLVANNGERLSILPSGNIGIGETNPTDHLQILHTSGKGLTFKTTANHYAQITSDCNRASANNHLLAIEGHWNGTPVAEIALTAGSDTTNKDDGRIIFRTQASTATGLDQRMEIDRAGHILISANSLQTFTSRGGFYNDTGGSSPGVQIEGSTYYDASLSITRNGIGTSGPNFIMAKGRGSTTKVEPDDILAQMSFQGAEGTGDMVEGAKIVAKVESSTGTSNIPTRLEFWTNSGSNVSTERLHIDSNGRILVGPGAIATPKCGYAGIDIPNYDYSIVMGGSDGNGNRANNAIKDGRFCGAHYNNAEEPVGIIRYSIGSTASELHMGGGSSLINAATQLSFYTAANTTTTGGSERLKITSTGQITHSGGHQANSGGANLGNGTYNRINASVSIPINSTKTLTFTGLQTGWMTIRIGGYGSAGHQAINCMYELGGYMTATYTYDVHTVRQWARFGSISTSKNASNFTVTLPNTSTSYVCWAWITIEGNGGNLAVNSN